MAMNRQDIVRGYIPVAKLDTNFMATPKALSNMGFDVTEVEKLDTIKQAKKQLKETSKLRKVNVTLEQIERVISDNGISIQCDICKMNSNSIDIIALTSIEQESKLPPNWGILRLQGQESYALIPSGIVIDYPNAIIYRVCGRCQVLLGLRAAESGLLINEIRDNYGFVDFDRIDQMLSGIRCKNCGSLSGGQMYCVQCGYKLK